MSDSNDETRQAILMRRIAIGVLTIGVSISALVFVSAPPEPEIDYAGVYASSVSNSKKLQFELERIGGKGAVVAAELTEWFGSLWHGRRLAGTLAVLTLVAALLCLLVSKLPPQDD